MRVTKLLEQAFEALGKMPSGVQDEIARALLGLADDAELDDVEPEHLPAVLDGMAQADRGEFASGDAGVAVRAAFRRAEP